MPLSQRVFSLLLATLLLTHSFLSVASSAVDSPALRFSGFATVGAVWGGDDVLGFRRDLPQEGVFDQDMSLGIDSLLGLQLDAKVNDRLGGAVQLVIKDRLDDSPENNVAWAFARYRFNPEWTLRVGRIGLDVYLLSEYRNLGFSYLWARPPVEFYSPVAFDSFDGADLVWSIPLADGLFRAKFYGGRVRNDFFVQKVVELELNPTLGLSLSWESERWQLRMTAAQNRFDKDLEYFPGLDGLAEILLAAEPVWPDAPSLAEQMEVNRERINYYTVGAAYNSAPWQVQAEVGLLDSEVDVYPTLLSSYLSVGRQVGPVTFYTMLADADQRTSRLAVPAPPVIPFPPGVSEQLALLADATRSAFDGASIDQSSLSFGARWDIRYDMALKFQWDRSWVHRYGSALWERRSTPTDDRVLDTFSLNLNVIF